MPFVMPWRNQRPVLQACKTIEPLSLRKWVDTVMQAVYITSREIEHCKFWDGTITNKFNKISSHSTFQSRWLLIDAKQRFFLDITQPTEASNYHGALEWRIQNPQQTPRAEFNFSLLMSGNENEIQSPTFGPLYGPMRRETAT